MNELQLERQIIAHEKRLNKLNSMERQIRSANSFFANSPGLRGFWPFNSFDASANAYDQSGQGRTLTRAGNSSYNITNQGTMYYYLDGSGDWFSRPDEAALDILCNEAYVNANIRGLTIGICIQTLTWAAGTTYDIFDKTNPGAENFRFYISGGTNTYRMSVTGGAGNTNFSIIAPANNQWLHFVVKYVPGVEIAAFVNGVRYASGAAIAAPLNNSTAPLSIGVYGDLSTNPTKAYICMAHLNACAWPDYKCYEAYQVVKPLLGI